MLPNYIMKNKIQNKIKQNKEIKYNLNLIYKMNILMIIILKIKQKNKKQIYYQKDL